MSSSASPVAPGQVRPGHAAIIGSAAGILGGLFGVGGGFIIVPALIGFAKMDRRLAHGTSMAATLPIALGTMITYAFHGHVDWTVAALMTIGSIAGAIVGTYLLRVVPHNVLVLVFVATVLATAARLLIGSEPGGRADLDMLMAVLLVGIGFLTGVLAGLLGIGGGVVRVPAMVVLLDMPAVIAKGTSAAVIVPTAVVGTIRNHKHGNVDIRSAATVGLFGAAAAVVGGLISTSLSERLSNAMFAVLLLFVAISQLLSLRRTPSAQPEPIGSQGN